MADREALTRDLVLIMVFHVLAKPALGRRRAANRIFERLILEQLTLVLDSKSIESA